jgi:hypothetical protein
MTLTKDGSPLSGEFNTELKEKIIPQRKLSHKEKELNNDNEWLAFLKGERGPSRPAVTRKDRVASRYVSRGQRGAVMGEKDGPSGRDKNNAQRKAVG